VTSGKLLTRPSPKERGRTDRSLWRFEMEDFITESGDDYGKLRGSGRFKIQALAGNQMLAAVFVTSGWTHVKDPKGRARSIGMTPASTIFSVSRSSPCAGSALGVLTQLAVLGLILIMLRAIHRKIFVWHTAFWGEKASGWHYDLMVVLMNLVTAWTDGGKYVLWK